MHGHITCGRFTNEEDGFNKGRAIVEVGDNGNDLGSIFGSDDIAVYGFAIQGCAEFDTDCFPKWYAINIVCLLRR